MNNEIKVDIGYIIGELYPDVIISSEKIPQGAKPPLFVVKQINQDYSKLIGDISSSTITFDVSYYPEDTSSTRDTLQEVQMTLLRALSRNHRIILRNLNSTTVDEILHVTGKVTLRERIERPHNYMSSLDINGSIKEE